MTISSTLRRAGPYVGNGALTVFPFTFAIQSQSDIRVVVNRAGVEYILTLIANYTVQLNASQDTNPGGTITLTTAITAAETVSILSNALPTQPVSLSNVGFFPKTVERALDRITILIQQAFEGMSRSLQFPVTDVNSGALPAAAARAGRTLVFDSVTGAPKVSDDTYANSASASAANAAAAAASAVQAVSAATLARNVFYGAYGSDPTTRPDTTARQAGDCYYNTSSLLVRVWNGSAWANAYTPPGTTPYLQMYFTGSSQVVADVSTGFAAAAGTNLWKFGTITVDANDGTGWNTGTGIFTAPLAGKYEVICGANLTTTASPTLLQVQPLIAGAVKADLRMGAVSSNYQARLGFQIKLSASQTLELRAWVSDINGTTLGAGTRVAASGSLQIAYLGP